MINGFKINVSGTVFTAASTTTIDRTNKELAQEQIPSIDKSAKTQKSEQISYETTAPLANSTLVAFKDPTNDKYVILSLKNSTIDILKSHFEKDDFYKRDDGIIRLDNKAESYVSGWFADIAYKRGFLKADSDRDGKLSDFEYGNTKNAYYINGGISNDNKSLFEKVSNKYLEVSSKEAINYRPNNRPDTIDNELDWTLSINNDFDKNISLKESYNKPSNSNNYENVVFNHAMKLIPNAVKAAMSEDLTLKLLEKETKESKKQLEALQKLKMTKGDVSTLNKNELKALDGLLPSNTEKINNETIDKISKNIIDQMKIQEAYKTQDNENSGKIMTLKG